MTHEDKLFIGSILLGRLWKHGGMDLMPTSERVAVARALHQLGITCPSRTWESLIYSKESVEELIAETENSDGEEDNDEEGLLDQDCERCSQKEGSPPNIEECEDCWEYANFCLD